MVSEDSDIHTKHILERILHVTLEELEIERTLHLVAGIDEKHILVDFPHRVDDCLALHHASPAVIVRQYQRMRIISMQNH